jgi:hypothetical protein
VARVQRLARERADAEARRIPWQRLLDTRNQYIDWQEFYLWVRSILEVENRIPDWLVEILDERCPGFVENGKKLTPKAVKTGESEACMLASDVSCCDIALAPVAAPS